MLPTKRYEPEVSAIDMAREWTLFTLHAGLYRLIAERLAFIILTIARVIAQQPEPIPLEEFTGETLNSGRPPAH
jgi:hypothetical protein